MDIPDKVEGGDNVYIYGPTAKNPSVVLHDKTRAVSSGGRVIVVIHWVGPQGTKCATRNTMLVEASNIILKRLGTREEEEQKARTDDSVVHDSSVDANTDTDTSIAVTTQQSSHQEMPIDIATSPGIDSCTQQDVPAWASLWRSGSCTSAPDYVLSPEIRRPVDFPQERRPISSDIVDQGLKFMQRVACCSGAPVYILRWSIANVRVHTTQTIRPTRMNADLLSGITLPSNTLECIWVIMYMEVDDENKDKLGHWVAVKISMSCKLIAVYDSRLQGHNGDHSRQDPYTRCTLRRELPSAEYVMSGMLNKNTNPLDAARSFRRGRPYGVGLVRILKHLDGYTQKSGISMHRNNGRCTTEFEDSSLYGGELWRMHVYPHFEAQSENNCASAALACIDQAVKMAADRNNRRITVNTEWLGQRVLSHRQLYMKLNEDGCRDRDTGTEDESASDYDIEDMDEDSDGMYFSHSLLHRTSRNFFADACQVTTEQGDKTRKGFARITEYPGYWLSKYCKYSAVHASVREAVIAATGINNIHEKKRVTEERNAQRRGVDDAHARNDGEFDSMVYEQVPAPSILMHKKNRDTVSKTLIVHIDPLLSSDDTTVSGDGLECAKNLVTHVRYTEQRVRQYVRGGLFGDDAKRACDDTNYDGLLSSVYENVYAAHTPHTHEHVSVLLADIKDCISLRGPPMNSEDHVIVALIFSDQTTMQQAKMLIDELEKASTRARLSVSSSVSIVVAVKLGVDSILLNPPQRGSHPQKNLRDMLLDTHVGGTNVHHTNAGADALTDIWTAYTSHSGAAAKRAVQLTHSSQAIPETHKVLPINPNVKRFPRPDPALVFGEQPDDTYHRQVYCMPY